VNVSGDQVSLDLAGTANHTGGEDVSSVFVRNRGTTDGHDGEEVGEAVEVVWVGGEQAKVLGDGGCRDQQVGGAASWLPSGCDDGCSDPP